MANTIILSYLANNEVSECVEHDGLQHDDSLCIFSSVGYFVQPTVVEVTDTKDKIFSEEIFGPIVSAYVYPDSQTKAMLKHVINDTPYALTGALYSQDQ